ncbi:2-hydroxyhepta-2,4-diene-1,7-dioate isomerase [Colletotrichum tofieldiae]|nr:2-hydroxyhepta-2,4-diene-1,7-dioate isomerase [Colletotrichum tofieldiae]
MIRNEHSLLWHDRKSLSAFAVQRNDVTLHLPMSIGGFTDFICAYEHVHTMGAFPGHDEVPSNSYHIPLAYNGRASSVVISGVPIIRPWGYIPTPDGPKFQPTQKMDFEVEMGIFIAKPLDIGEAVPASQARDHIFGMVLLNDWSARDIKFYEMVPLGPFNGKACGTSISPWIVTLDALEEAGAVIDVEAGKLPGGKWAKDSFLAYSRDVSVQVTTHISRMAAQKPSFPQQCNRMPMLTCILHKGAIPNHCLHKASLNTFTGLLYRWLPIRAPLAVV